MKNRLTFGIGINDAGYPIKDCPFFRTWKNMLKRCYSGSGASYHKAHPTYKGCSVSEEWLTFSVFREWMCEQDWHDKCLDKDLLLLGNKVYSPSTCCFISQRVNKFLSGEKTSGSGLPVGVSIDTKTGKYRAQIRNLGGARTFLGLYTSVEQANRAYLTSKHHIACELSLSENNPLVKYALAHRYTPIGMAYECTSHDSV